MMIKLFHKRTAFETLIILRFIVTDKSLNSYSLIFHHFITLTDYCNWILLTRASCLPHVLYREIESLVTNWARKL